MYGQKPKSCDDPTDPTLLRSITGITLGYQTGSALFGGTAPMIATVLLSAYHNSWVPLAIFVCTLCLASLISATFIRNSKIDAKTLAGVSFPLNNADTQK